MCIGGARMHVTEAGVDGSTMETVHARVVEV